MNKINKKKGFTLVELIIVVAIVAILAAVGIIGYSQFIKSARDSTATNELSQLYNVIYADAAKPEELKEYAVAVESGKIKFLFSNFSDEEIEEQLETQLTGLLNMYINESFYEGEFVIENNLLTYNSHSKGTATKEIIFDIPFKVIITVKSNGEFEVEVIDLRLEVTFFYGNYVGAPVNEIKKIVEGQTVDKPTDPKRVGNEFLGWYLEDELFDFNKEITENIHLTAKHENLFLLFINENSTVEELNDGLDLLGIENVEEEILTVIHDELIANDDFTQYVGTGEFEEKDLNDFNNFIAQAVINYNFIKEADFEQKIDELFTGNKINVYKDDVDIERVFEKLEEVKENNEELNEMYHEIANSLIDVQNNNLTRINNARALVENEIGLAYNEEDLVRLVGDKTVRIIRLMASFDKAAHISISSKILDGNGHTITIVDSIRKDSFWEHDAFLVGSYGSIKRLIVDNSGINGGKQPKSAFQSNNVSAAKYAYYEDVTVNGGKKHGIHVNGAVIHVRRVYTIETNEAGITLYRTNTTSYPHPPQIVIEEAGKHDPKSGNIKGTGSYNFNDLNMGSTLPVTDYPNHEFVIFENGAEKDYTEKRFNKYVGYSSVYNSQKLALRIRDLNLFDFLFAIPGVNEFKFEVNVSLSKTYIIDRPMKIIFHPSFNNKDKFIILSDDVYFNGEKQEISTVKDEETFLKALEIEHLDRITLDGIIESNQFIFVDRSVNIDGDVSKLALIVVSEGVVINDELQEIDDGLRVKTEKQLLEALEYDLEIIIDAEITLSKVLYLEKSIKFVETDNITNIDKIWIASNGVYYDEIEQDISIMVNVYNEIELLEAVDKELDVKIVETIELTKKLSLENPIIIENSDNLINQEEYLYILSEGVYFDNELQSKTQVVDVTIKTIVYTNNLNSYNDYTEYYPYEPEYKTGVKFKDLENEMPAEAKGGAGAGIGGEGGEDGTFIGWFVDGEEVEDIETLLTSGTIERRWQKGKDGKNGSSPYVYSLDKDGEFHLEHEPISYNVLRSLESTNFGTLKLIEANGGKYYIQVIERGISTTNVNGVKMYAVDYINDGEVIDLLFDIYGNPHTIKAHSLPKSFVDKYGNSFLNEITSIDEVFTYIIEDDRGFAEFIATFDRINNNRYAKFIITVMDKGNTDEAWFELLEMFNGKQNLWLLDQLILSSDYNKEMIKNIQSVLELKVQVWDGKNWITQGSIQPGALLNETFVVNLDLLGINSSEIMVRLLMPTTTSFAIDYVAIDFKENLPMIIHELELNSALLHNGVNVFDIVSDLNNNQHVTLKDEEYVMFGFNEIELLAGYTRGFGVEMKGFIYTHPEAISNDGLMELMKDKTDEEIIQIILDSNQEKYIDELDLVTGFLDMLLYIGSLDEEERILSFLS